MPGSYEPMRHFGRKFHFSITLPGLVLAAAQGVSAQPSQSPFGGANRFRAQDGEAIYRTICQGCHMPEGEGAAGAGRYPALAANTKLDVPGYAVVVVVNGLRAMPAFASKQAPSGCLLSDDQVAAVVNYVRTHFGNRYTDNISAGGVKSGR